MALLFERIIRVRLTKIAFGVFCALTVRAESVFVGTTPCTETIRPLLQIPADANSELIRWELTLLPAGYKLRCEHESTTNKGTKVIQKEGTWTATKGIKSNPDAVVYELNGAVALFQLDSNILHILNPDRSLMIGHGGWSYTLNRKEAAEKAPDPRLALMQPDMSYQIAPLATGPNVFGVFEGRTPCQGIARELKVRVDPANTKVKWRVTLYQNPDTRAPTTYKIEGSLHRRTSREGTWSISSGAEGTIYRLAQTDTEPAILLLKGDDHVLFFLDQNRKPRVGHADFSYTLNRRNGS